MRNGEFLSSQHDCVCLGKIRGQLSTTNVNISGIKAKKNLPGKESEILGMSSSVPSLEGALPRHHPEFVLGLCLMAPSPERRSAWAPSREEQKAPGSSFQMLCNIQPLLLDPTPIQIPKAFLRNFRGTVNTGLQETAILRVFELMR